MKTLFLILLMVPLFGLSQIVKQLPVEEGFTKSELREANKNLAGALKNSVFYYWKQYIDDCNTLVPDTIKQSGTVNVKYKPVIVNGEVSHYILSPIDTVFAEVKCGTYKTDVWGGFRIGSGLSYDTLSNFRWSTTLTGAIHYSPVEQVNNKINITRNKICHIKKRKANWDDFWNRWLVEKKIIQTN